MPKPFNARRTLRRLGAPFAFEARFPAELDASLPSGMAVPPQNRLASLNLVCGRGESFVFPWTLLVVEPMLNQFV